MTTSTSSLMATAFGAVNERQPFDSSSAFTRTYSAGAARVSEGPVGAGFSGSIKERTSARSLISLTPKP